MQPDTHGSSSDSVPLPDPSSPTLPAYRHHPQPTPAVEPSNPFNSTGLRQRHTQNATASGSGSMLSSPVAPSSGASHDDIRIYIQTPLSDSAEGRKEMSVSRNLLVRELKDGLAEGRWDSSTQWVREGMRLVWRGRIVKDQETLGEVIKDIKDAEQVHVFHLVARTTRPVPSRASSFRPTTSIPAAPTLPLPHRTPTPASASPLSPRTPPLSRNATALADTIHYLLFTARHHLCHLLNAPVLRWEDTVPPPVIEQSVARQAVMTVVKAYAEQRGDREEGWEGWERAFDEERENPESSADETDRGALESDIRSLWSGRVGRNWTDSDEGESVIIELDEVPYQLHLPPLRLLSVSQLVHLHIYLRITSLITLLTPILEAQSIESTLPAQLLRPTPTSGTQAALLQQLQVLAQAQGPHQARAQPRVLLRLRIPIIPLPVLSHMGFSALKVGAMLWMMTRDMAWSDLRFWLLAGAAGGWWIGDGFGMWARARPPQPQAQAQARGEHQARAQEGQGGQPRAAEADLPTQGDGQGQPQGANHAQVHADAPHHAQAALAGQRQPPQSTAPISWSAIPLIHLATDADQLGHPSVFTSASAQLNPPRPARIPPPRWQTDFLLPIALWFITLIPEFETIRARAIRRRERAIRVSVGEATARAQREARVSERAGQAGATEGGAATTSETGEEPNADAMALDQERSAGNANNDRQETGEEQRDSMGSGTEPAEIPPVFPAGLNHAALRYYRRVLARGEGIDWEEEREAQRAMGIGEAEAEGDGMRMRML